MKPEIAIIGSGISGLACLYFLSSEYNITLFEANDYIGGHTNTVYVEEDNKTTPIDSGFMVYNERTYPNLIKLFEKLGVESYDTSMSFGVQNTDHDIEMSFSSINTLFAQRKNYLNLGFYKLARDISRFFKDANHYLQNGESHLPTLNSFLENHRYGNNLKNHFLLPMISAIWSTPSSSMLNYPTRSLFEFMDNHGLLGIGTQFTWKTVKNGSNSYKNKILSETNPTIRLNDKVNQIEKNNGLVKVVTRSGYNKYFDKVILASHANQSLGMLKFPTPLQEKLLSPFQYNVNTAILHKDSKVMPQSKRAWASWNYRIDLQNNKLCGSTHYWMNNLQNIDSDQNYFVSIDYPETFLNPESILWKRIYEHPRFNLDTSAAQKDLQLLNENGNIYFAGSYFGHGFHEDGLKSGMEVSKRILRKKDLWS